MMIFAQNLLKNHMISSHHRMKEMLKKNNHQNLNQKRQINKLPSLKKNQQNSEEKEEHLLSPMKMTINIIMFINFMIKILILDFFRNL